MKQIFIFILLVTSLSGFTQEKFIFFNNNSNETVEVEIGNGKKNRLKKFRKAFKKNNDIHFYINNELFVFKYKESSIDTCKSKYFNKIKFSNLNNLKKKVNSTNPLYPYKVFPNLIIVEKEDFGIIKYRVKWEYYIE